MILKTIESEKKYLNIKTSDYAKEFGQMKNERYFENCCLIDFMVHFILNLNKKFMHENLVAKRINDTFQASKYLSETILKLFNSEVDPLLNYQIKFSEHNVAECSLDEYYFTNSLIKFISDLFTSSQTKNTTSIFYSSDFNVLIDIIIRKLSNLSANDQIRVDYLSMIQLIIKNSNYLENNYRKDDILVCFNSILNESEHETIDQDIVRVILNENPQLVF